MKQNTHGKIAPFFQNIYSLTFTGHPKCGGQRSAACWPHGEASVIRGLRGLRAGLLGRGGGRASAGLCPG